MVIKNIGTEFLAALNLIPASLTKAFKRNKVKVSYRTIGNIVKRISAHHEQQLA